MKDIDTKSIMFVFVRKLIGRIRNETCNSSFGVGNNAGYSFKDENVLIQVITTSRV